MFSLFGEYCWFVSKNGISTITHANNDVSNTYSDVMDSFDSLEQLLIYASFYKLFQRFVDATCRQKQLCEASFLFVFSSTNVENDCFYVIIIFVRGCAFPYDRKMHTGKQLLFVRAKIRNVKNDSLEYSDSLRASYLF